jgi:NAD+ diphosphatase
VNLDYQFCVRCASALQVVTLGGKLRHQCPACQWTHWNNPLPVLAAIVEYNDKILLARNAAWPEGMFALITGFMEADETPQQGIAREIKEETNLEASSIEFVGVYEFMRKNELIIAFHVKASGEVKLSEELLEYRLVAPEKLKPWRAGTGYAVADWLKRRNLPVEFVDLPKNIQLKPSPSQLE